MPSARSIFTEIVALIRAGGTIAVATIIEKTGSVPRAEGAKMVVRADGTTIGTIGGGRIEAETGERAREALRLHAPVIVPFRLRGEDVADTEMICGGEGRIFIDVIDGASPDERSLFAETAALAERGGRGWLVTELAANGGGLSPRARRCLLLPNGRATGSMQCPAAVAEELLTGPSRRSIRPLLLEDGRYFAEPLSSRGTARIFGAGHVGQRIAPLCAEVGFATIVCDDRPDLLRREVFPEPLALTIRSFDQPPDPPLDEESYVVIVTRGHLHDGEVVEHALRSPACYIGMIGSRRKKAILFDDLRAQGITDAELARIHTPIGIPIGAETPQEIAVSVVAEMIAVRAARERG